MTRKEILILLAMFSVFVLLIVGLLGLAGYFFYIGTQPRTAAGPIPAAPAAKPSALPTRPKPGAKPTAKLIVEKTRAEKAAAEAAAEIAGAVELFNEGDYRRSYDQHRRAMGRVLRYRTEFIGEITAGDWAGKRVKEYAALVTAKAAQFRKDLDAGNVDLARIGRFLETYGASEFREGLVPFSAAFQSYLRQFLSNKILVAITTQHPPYRDAVAKVLRAKFPKQRKYGLAFNKDLPRHYGAGPASRLNIYLSESQAIYKPDNGASFRIPRAITVRFDMSRGQVLQTSWDKIGATLIKAELPAELPADTNAETLGKKIRADLLPAIEKKLTELIPEFTLFPDIDVTTAKILQSSTRVDTRVVMAMAAKDPALLRKRITLLLASPPSKYTPRYLLAALVQADAEECRDLVLDAFEQLESRDFSYLFSPLRKNISYGDFDLALKAVTRPGGEDLVRYLMRHSHNPKVFDTLDRYCRDPEVNNRAKLVYNVIFALDHKRQAAYWAFLADKDERVAEMAARALRGHEEFPVRFVKYYDRIPAKARTADWGYIASPFLFRDGGDRDVVQLAEKVIKSERGATQEAAMRAISTDLRNPEAWSVCAELLPNITNPSETARLRSALTRYAPAGAKGEAFLQKVLIAQQAEARKVISDPAKLKRRFYNEVRIGTISGLLRVSDKPHDILKRLVKLLDDNPNDEPFAYATLTAISAAAGKLDFTWPEIDRFIRAGFLGKDYRSRRQACTVIRYAIKAGRTEYIEMVRKAAAAESDRRAKYDLERVLKSIAQ